MVRIHIKEGSVRNILQSVSKQKSKKKKNTTTKGEAKQTVRIIYSCSEKEDCRVRCAKCGVRSAKKKEKKLKKKINKSELKE